jgi:hypothetical protein
VDSEWSLVNLHILDTGRYLDPARISNPGIPVLENTSAFR